MLTNRFETILADTDDSRALHFEVRFKVFCEETGFENANQFPDGGEADCYDEHSTHFLIRDKLENRWVGAMRLIDARKTSLPSEYVCSSPLCGLDRRRPLTFEFSRLCILRNYRSTPAQTQFGFEREFGRPHAEGIPVIFRQTNNEILIRLLRATIAFGKKKQMRYCYFIATAALAKIFTRLGIPLKAVGEKVRYRGVRIPYRYNILTADRGMIETTPQFAELVRTEEPYTPYSKYADTSESTRQRKGKREAVFDFSTLNTRQDIGRFSPTDGRMTDGRFFADNQMADSTFL